MRNMLFFFFFNTYILLLFLFFFLCSLFRALYRAKRSSYKFENGFSYLLTIDRGPQNVSLPSYAVLYGTEALRGIIVYVYFRQNFQEVEQVECAFRERSDGGGLFLSIPHSRIRLFPAFFSSELPYTRTHKYTHTLFLYLNAHLRRGGQY